VKISEAFPSQYLKAADLDSDTTYTIDRVEMETLGQGKNKEDKPVAYFRETDKSLALNKTNSNVISGLYGDDTDNWVGKRVTLYSTEVEFQGNMTLAIRIRMKKPAATAQTSAGTASTPVPQGRTIAWQPFCDKVREYNAEHPDDAYSEDKRQEVFDKLCEEVWPGKKQGSYRPSEWKILAERINADFSPATEELLPM
jgi:hypothetical protein